MITIIKIMTMHAVQWMRPLSCFLTLLSFIVCGATSKWPASRWTTHTSTRDQFVLSLQQSVLDSASFSSRAARRQRKGIKSWSCLAESHGPNHGFELKVERA
jgi:hypothetical protein